MTRKILPQRRRCETATISFAGERYHVTTGFYPDGSPGEIFINRIRDKAAARLGEQLDGICRDSAILLSLSLQHGADLTAIRRAITRNDDNEPSTIVGAIVDMLKDGPNDDDDPQGAPRIPHAPVSGPSLVEPAI